MSHANFLRVCTYTHVVRFIYGHGHEPPISVEYRMVRALNYKCFHDHVCAYVPFTLDISNCNHATTSVSVNALCIHAHTCLVYTSVLVNYAPLDPSAVTRVCQRYVCYNDFPFIRCRLVRTHACSSLGPHMTNDRSSSSRHTPF